MEIRKKSGNEVKMSVQRGNLRRGIDFLFLGT